MKLSVSFIEAKVPLIVRCTLALIGGIIWKTHYPFYPVIVLWFLLAAFHYNTHKPDHFYTLSLFFLIGFSMCWYQQSLFANFQKKTNGKTFDVVATVNDVYYPEKKRIQQVVCVSAQCAREVSGTEWHPCSGNILVQLHSLAETIRVQDTVEMRGIKFKSIANETFSSYLIKENLRTSLFLPLLDYTLLNRPTYSLKRLIFEKRMSLLRRYKKKLSPKTFALFSIVFLGNKNIEKSLAGLYKNHFKLWGISHHLARSGLHLLLLIILLQMMLRALQISYLYTQTILMSMVLIYSMLSWMSISYMRALLTFIFYSFLNSFKIQVGFLDVVALVTIIVLIFNPIQLFFLDFQLSFGLTFALAWLNHTKKGAIPPL